VLSLAARSRGGDAPGFSRRAAVVWAAWTSWLPRGPAAVRTVGLASLLLWAAFISFVSVARYGGDFRALLCLGERAYHPAALAWVPTAGPAGYDGQQYGALATDPLLRKPDTPRALDAPAYRATRVLLPLLAWGLALGHGTWAVVAYQLLCWGLGLSGVFLAAHWLAAEGHSPWWALPLAGGAGLVASIIRSTPDAAAVCLVLLALWLHDRDRAMLAVLACIAAVLTRETSYLAALAIAVDHLRHRRVALAAAVAALPLALVGGWQVYLRGALGARYFVVHGSFTAPFVWLGEKIPTLVQEVGIQWQEVFGLLAVVATTLALVLVASRPSTWAPPELTFLAFGALGLFLTYDVYVETWGYARILVALPFLSTVLAERQRSGFRRWTLRSVSVFYLLAGLVMLRWEVPAALSGRGVLAALRDASATRAAPGSDGTSATAGGPAGVRAWWVLPVANGRGRSDALWRTQLVLTNLSPSEKEILVDLHPAGGTAGSSLHRWVALAGGESRSWKNVAGELFNFSGTAALCLFSSQGEVAATSTTANSLAVGSAAPALPAVSAAQAIGPGGRARLAGLAYDPAPGAAVRTNIGLLNLSPRPLRVRIAAYDAGAQPLGALLEVLPPRAFAQVDDVFRRLSAGPVAGGSAVVEALTPAAFLSYATVIRGPTAQAAYVVPQPVPAHR
jgi:hypothetical protein